jgi:hypothetical protein
VRGAAQALKNRRAGPTTGPMSQPIQAAAAATDSTSAATATAKSAAKTSAKSFAGELAAASKPPARPDGEQTKKVAGHPFARIINGDDKGLYLNQVAGSPRQGAVFRLVERGDRVFHVYGTGKDKVIIGLDKTPGS